MYQPRTAIHLGSVPFPESGAEEDFARGLADLIGSGLEQLQAQNPSIGFTLVADTEKPRKRALAYSGAWDATDRELLANVWRFDFTKHERAVLDITTAEIDEAGP
ncbi:hypothetical protein ACWEPB_12200 [Kitasatospora cineracea]